MDTMEEDEPVTPAARFFLQPKMDTVINCVIGTKVPIDIDAVKAELHNTLLKHPRFCSILVRDRHGVERWRRTEVDVDKHLVFPSQLSVGEEEDSYGDAEELVNDYVADLSVSTPLDLSKPPWEIHVLSSNRCCVLRLHHALGDGISLMSLFLASCKRVDNPNLPPTIPAKTSTTTSSCRLRLSEKLRKLLMVCCLTLLYVIEFILHSLWKKDPKTEISGGAGVELWPRKLSTARFTLQDMKVVKNALNATINDVLLGIISSGLARYLKTRSAKLPKQLRVTGLALVNTRHEPELQDLSNSMGSKSKSRWGNQMGYIVLPLYLHKSMDEPLEYLKKAKAMLDKKKLSLEAHFSYRLGSLVMAVFGPKIATLLNYRIIANTTFTISNVVGPQEEIMFAGHPITYLRTSTSSIPHAITMHMVSYMGRADMQILVAKDIIPDPQFLAKCFQDALLEMKNAVTAKSQEATS